LTGLAPAILVLASPLPFWIRIWLWIPILGLSVAMTFGRVQGKSMISVLLSAWSFARRRRRRIWQRPERKGQQEVVIPKPRSLPDRGRLRSLLETALAYGVVTGIALTFALLLILGMRWLVIQMFTPVDTGQPAYVAGGAISPLPTPVPTLDPLPSPTPTPLPSPTPLATPYELPATGRQQEWRWDLLAIPGTLSMSESTSDACYARISAPGWEVYVAVPLGETVKLQVVPLLQPQTVGRVLTVESGCDLGVMLIPYRARHPQDSRVWLVPICDPPGRVWMRPRGGVASVIIVDPDGNSLTAPVTIPLSGAWAPSAPAEGCWLYRVEAANRVWLEVTVR
jgi:hypothetical protein